MNMRKVMRRYGMVLAGFAFLVGSLSAQQPAGSQPAQSGGGATGRNRPAARFPLPPGVEVIRDVEYVPGGSKSQRLDLYVPKDAQTPLPLVVWIHGGAWRSGDKGGAGPAVGLLRFGYVIASINYRLSQEAIFPAQIEDCKAAIRWLRANAKKYNVDPDRIGVWGGSAGGHLVALLGTSGDVKELEGQLGNLEQSSRVQAVCDWYGPTDFTRFGPDQKADEDHRPQNNNDPQAVVEQLLGPPEGRKEQARLASPVTFVGKDDPPFLIMHGDKDPVVPCEQSKILHDLLQKAGVSAELVIVKGAGHNLPGTENFMKVKEFFDRTLKAGSPTTQPSASTTQKAAE